MESFSYVSAGQVVKGAILKKENYQTIDGGKVIKTSIYSGGMQIVSTGLATSTTIRNGGTQIVGNVIWDNGKYLVGGNCSAVKTTVLKGGNLNLIGGAKVRLTAGKTMAGVLGVQGVNNIIYSLKTNSKSNISFWLNAPTTKLQKYIVTADKKAEQSAKCCLTVAKYQKAGTYYLSKNMIFSTGKSFTIHILNDVNPGQYQQTVSKIGTAKLNGKVFSKNGFAFSLATSGATVKLTISLKTGIMRKASAKGGKITGTTDSDIFCGGKGNDTFSGKKGRDVAVYGKGAWGSDVISKTSGTMTILFNDVKRSDVNMESSNNDLIITKKSDATQRIVLKNYDDGSYGVNQTHDIVFASGMKAFNKYLKASKPTAKITTAARNEVWKKAKLA